MSRQDSGGSLPVDKATKNSKTSRTNLSEASADTGILGDIDNKVKKIVFSTVVFKGSLISNTTEKTPLRFNAASHLES